MARTARPKQHLIPVSIIQALTGWDKKWMQRARESGLVQQVYYLDAKTGKRKIKYDLNSLRKEFIIKRYIGDEDEFCEGSQ
jgi:hypothetical protein